MVPGGPGAARAVEAAARKEALNMLTSPISPLRPMIDTDVQPVQQNAADGGFGSIFKQAVDAVKETDAEKTQLQYLQATGQLDNPAQLMLAGSKYEMSVNLLVQLRNRAVEAYNEIMRISL